MFGKEDNTINVSIHVQSHITIEPIDNDHDTVIKALNQSTLRHCSNYLHNFFIPSNTCYIYSTMNLVADPAWRRGGGLPRRNGLDILLYY